MLLTLDSHLFCLGTPNILCKFDISNASSPQLMSSGTVGFTPGMSMRVCAEKKQLFIVTAEHELFVVNCSDLKIVAKISNVRGLYVSQIFSISKSGQFVWGSAKYKMQFYLKFISIPKKKLYCLMRPKHCGRINMIHCAQSSNRLVYVSKKKHLVFINSRSNKYIDQSTVPNNQQYTCCKLPQAYTLLLGSNSQQTRIVNVQNKIQVLWQIDHH